MFKFKEFYHKPTSVVQYFLGEGIFFAVDPEVRET
jgi:hypothetical protein